MRTVKELLNLNGDVYVYTPDKSVARLFLKNAAEIVARARLKLPHFFHSSEILK